jgi:3-mercaptopyruvate sulfurtransferase SseA
MNRRILASLFLIPLLVAAACNGGGATTTTSGDVTTQTETSSPGTVPQPSVLEKQGFALPELTRISAEDLKVIYDNRDPLILVDVRPKDLFDTGYIPGSRNIPNEPQADSLNKLTQLPKDKLIVLYCD